MRFYCIIENRVPRSSSKLWPTGREISKPNCLLGHAEWWANSPWYVLSALWVLRDDVHKGFSSKSLNSRYPMLYTLSLYIPLGDFSRNPVKLFYAFLLYNWKPSPEKFSKIVTKALRTLRDVVQNRCSSESSKTRQTTVRRFCLGSFKIFLYAFTV